jgi:hypothetical protein
MNARTVGGGVLAAALAGLGVVAIAMGVRGSYYAVWRVVAADAKTFAVYKAGAQAQQQGQGAWTGGSK